MLGNDKHKEAIFALLEKLADEGKVVNWGDIWKDLEDIIVQDYDGGESSRSYKSYWKGQVKKVANSYDFRFAREDYANQWSIIEPKLKVNANQNDQFPEASSEVSSEEKYSSSKSPTTSLKYQKKLTAVDKQKIDATFEKITNKWSLQSGKVVEDVIYECSQDFSFEHPSHSLILNIKDPEWTEKFNDIVKAEIEKAGNNDLLKKPLPSNLLNMLRQLSGKTTFKKMYVIFNKIEADPIENPDEYWVKQSILEYINLFIGDDKMAAFNTEQDLLDEVYGCIKKSIRISKTKTETASGSAASSESKNRNRTIASTSQEARQVPCDHADLVFKYLSNEIGCVEIGLKDRGPNGTKELNERELKTPKMLKSFYTRLLSQYLVKIDGAKTVGIVISGIYISAMIMNFDHGSTSLLSMSKRLKMPKSLSEIPLLLPPVIKLVYNCAQVVKSTAATIRQITSTVPPDSESESENYFPPCFFTGESSNKRRKHNSLNVNISF